MTDNPLIAALRTFRRRFFEGIEATLFVLVLAILVLIALQVFTRYVLQVSVPWTEEVARMVLVWAVMLGAAVAMERGQHYTITIFSAQFRGLTRMSVVIVTNLLGLIFLAALVRYGAQYMAANMKTVYISTQVSRGWIYLAMPVGAAIMAVSLTLQSVEMWLSRGEVPAPSGLPPARDV